MTLADQARVIVRDIHLELPRHIRQSCQRVIINTACREPVAQADKVKVKAVYKTHYARYLRVQTS